MKKALYLILAGVVIGILIAPDKGSETWRKLKENFDNLKESATDHINNLVSKGKELVGEEKDVMEISQKESAETANPW